MQYRHTRDCLQPPLGLGLIQMITVAISVSRRFRVPNFGTVTKQQLLDFLGDCLNPNVVAVTLPADAPPVIEQLIGFIPLATGSGGKINSLITTRPSLRPRGICRIP